MARNERKWSDEFIEYMNFIANHENYKGLPIEKKKDGTYKWLASAKTEIGILRKKWAEEKAIEFGIENKPGVYQKVMFNVHPTKEKVCQICGETMSLFYIYPNSSFIKSLKNKFKFEFNEITSIYDIWDYLLDNGIEESLVIDFFINSFDLSNSIQKEKAIILKACEQKCRNGESKYLGPGAMSNFPDRFDGFHSYNRCCRSSNDTGRFSDNLRTYTKDRRAYERWSDGNIHAANKFMGSKFFKGTSADHIGPISLGFIHDPRYLQKMSNGENSTKRDRLQREDIEQIINVKNKTGVYPMTWYSSKIWNYIESNFKSATDSKIEEYRIALKKNTANYMEILWIIMDKCSDKR